MNFSPMSLLQNQMPDGSESSYGLWLAGGAALVVLGLLGRAVTKQKKAEPPRLPQSGATLQVEAPAPAEVRVTLAKSAQEEAKRAEEEAARLKAQEARAKLLQLQKSEGSEEEAIRVKDELEAASKEAYRAKRAAETEEKERKKREREEEEKIKSQTMADAKLQAEAAEAKRLEFEQERLRAEGGQTLAAGLARTKNEGFMARLNGLFGGGPKVIDEKVLADLEDVLFTADIGVKTASSLVELAREKIKSKDVADVQKLKALIRKEIERILDLKPRNTFVGGGPPQVIMVVGVNGAGKTTTIGKLAAKAKESGKKVVLAAGDTFRAAAAEQLDVWAERAGAELVKGKEESDPSAVIFEAVKRAREIGADVVIADTAGRLHTKVNLMEELKKVKRVIDKALPGAPHEVLLVLDATNGQNAIAQARQFHDAVGLTSIALTKLDGTAKGGVVIGICDELKVPITWAGVGEKVSDLRVFNPREFVAALFDD
jgi:fused signal recognition particle receptor